MDLCDHLGLSGANGSAGTLFFSNGTRESKAAFAGTTMIPTRTWNHVALVRDSTSVRVYLNGNPTPELAGEAQGIALHDAEQVFIGGRFDGVDNFEGKIDEVAIYKRALSPQEVAEHFKVSGMISPTANGAK